MPTAMGLIYEGMICFFLIMSGRYSGAAICLPPCKGLNYLSSWVGGALLSQSDLWGLTGVGLLALAEGIRMYTYEAT
jgi:hypothetical protein